MGREINPLARKPVDKPLDVGVRAINALLTVGRASGSASSPDRVSANLFFLA